MENNYRLLTDEDTIEATDEMLYRSGSESFYKVWQPVNPIIVGLKITFNRSDLRRPIKPQE